MMQPKQVIGAIAALVVAFGAAISAQSAFAEVQLDIQIDAQDIVYLQSTGQHLVITQPFEGAQTPIAWLSLNPQQLMPNNLVSWSPTPYSFYSASNVPMLGAVILPNESSTLTSGAIFSFDGSSFTLTSQTGDGTFKLTNATNKALTFGLSQPYTANGAQIGHVPVQATVVYGQGIISIKAPTSVSLFMSNEPVSHGQVINQPMSAITKIDVSTSGTNTVRYNRQTGGFDVIN